MINFDHDRECKLFYDWAVKYADEDSTHSYLDSMTKTMYAQAYMRAEGDTVKEKEMKAYLDEEYVNHLQGVGQARKLRNEALAARNAQERKLEWARSVLSYKKKEMELI